MGGTVVAAQRRVWASETPSGDRLARVSPPFLGPPRPESLEAAALRDQPQVNVVLRVRTASPHRTRKPRVRGSCSRARSPGPGLQDGEAVVGGPCVWWTVWWRVGQGDGRRDPQLQRLGGRTVAGGFRKPGCIWCLQDPDNEKRSHARTVRLTVFVSLLSGPKKVWGEGHGNPLQYSCLENPMDRGAWWAVVQGVTQSRTRLKRLSMHACRHWRRKWHPTPVFVPGESQGQRSLVGCLLWGRTESDTTEAT